jgi:hypothetical protein
LPGADEILSWHIGWVPFKFNPCRKATQIVFVNKMFNNLQNRYMSLVVIISDFATAAKAMENKDGGACSRKFWFWRDWPQRLGHPTRLSAGGK